MMARRKMEDERLDKINEEAEEDEERWEGVRRKRMTR